MSESVVPEGNEDAALGARRSLSLSRHLRSPRQWRGGPAWLVMIADVDAASILTALASGAAFRYDLVWFLVALTLPLFFIQDAAGQIGAVAGKGLGELAREHYSRRVAATVALSMAIGDGALYVAEYAGIALGLGLFGVPPAISLPSAFVAHLALVAERRYAWVEKVLIGVSAGIVIALLVVAFHVGLAPYSPFGVSSEPAFYFLLAANTGAVVMPFMLFFQSSATATKHTSRAISRQSTLIGAVASETLMILIVVIGAAIGVSLDVTSEAGFSSVLVSVLGASWAYVLAIGIVAAAFLALVVISLGSAWGLTEAFGFSPKSIPWVYGVESVPAVVVPLLFPKLVVLVLAVMVAMVFVLIVPGVLVGRLASDPRVMGAETLRPFWRSAYWTSLAVVIGVGIIGAAFAL